jgi:hypothetical protein
VIRWKGPKPTMSPTQYEQAKALWVHRRGAKGPSEESVTAYAREQGLNPVTVLNAARRGIKRYEREAHS